MKRQPRWPLAAFLSACLATPGSAAIIKSVDLAGPGPDVPSLFFDLGDGLTLTITAGIHSGSSSANAPLTVTGTANVTQSGGGAPGIGVRSLQPGDSSQLDSAGPNEFLRFTYNQEVTLQTVVFEAASNAGPGSDEFDGGVDGVDLQINDTFGTDTLRSFPGAGFPGGTDREVDFSGGVDFAGDGTNDLFPAEGMEFTFYTDDGNDDYRIRSITVDLNPLGQSGDDDALVPEAASSMVWLGLIGMAAARRRMSN